MDSSALFEQAKAVLAANDKHGKFTIPATGMYPHQWLWDSCFVAIGLRHIDIDRAQKEVLNLLRGQWANGMLPHMVFAKGDEHRRDRNMWRSWVSPYAPDDVATSGITQPPLLAEAVVRIGELLSLPERRTWYQTVFQALVKYHLWLYTERDPHKEHLVLQVHPWETGLDNTPPWVHELHQHKLPLWITIIDKCHLDTLVSYFRRDVHYVPPGQRLSTIDALAFYSVQRRLRRKAYDINKILGHSIFAIEDLTFNAILIRANKHLRTIAKTINHPLPDELEESFTQSEEAFEQLWDAYSGQYYSRDFFTHKLIKVPTIATLMPLYAGCITKERANQLVKLLEDKKQFATRYPVPSVPLKSEWYNEFGYWQGPTWINTNWLIIDGLERYGYKKLAEQLRNSSFELIEKSGFYEYFSAKTGEPAGIGNFSWTAALIIDLLKRTKPKK